MSAEVKREEGSVFIPDEFLCPVMQTIMKDPVVASDGHTYERGWIELFFGMSLEKRIPCISPLTNKIFTSADLIPNTTLKNLIDIFSEYRTEIPEFFKKENGKEFVPKEFLRLKEEKGIMTNPVVASDGYSYEEEEIKIVLEGYSTATNLSESPKTKAPLLNKTLVPNLTLKSLIAKFPEYRRKIIQEAYEEKTRKLGVQHARKIEELEGQLRGFEISNSALQNEKRAIEREKEEIKKTLQDKSSENNKQKKEITRLTNEKGQLETQLGNLKRRDEGHKASLDKLKKEHQEALKEAKKQPANNGAQERADLESKLAAMQKHLDDFKRPQVEPSDPAEIQYRLGVRYLNGEIDVEENSSRIQAAFLFRGAARLGHPSAEFYQGGFHAIGLVDEKNNDTALPWLLRAAEQGHSGAQYFLGKCFYNSDENFAFSGTPKEAVEWLQKIARNEMPDHEACVKKYLDAKSPGKIKGLYGEKQGQSGKKPTLISKLTPTHKWGIFTVIVASLVALLLAARSKSNDSLNTHASDVVIPPNTLPEDGEMPVIHSDHDNVVDAPNTQLFETNLPIDPMETVVGTTKPEIHQQEVKLLKEAAKQGNPVAQYQLGLRYAAGVDIKQDDKQAAHWYRRSADQGNVEAQVSLGDCYLRGRGVEQDDQEAEKWWVKAAGQGDANAVFKFGQLRVKGQAKKLFQAGHRHIEERKFAEALKVWKTAAEMGHPEAQYSVGEFYANGEKGVLKKDLQEAAKWWKQAAEGWRREAKEGDKQAQYRLARLYEDGKGVVKDFKQAMHWHQKAAAQGLGVAQFSIGLLYEHGLGVEKNLPLAIECFQKAAEQGYEFAEPYLKEHGYAISPAKTKQQVEELYKLGHLYDKEGKFTETLNAWKTAGEAGHPGAQYGVGQLYADGNDHQEAAKWWKKAADQGLEVAQFSLGVLYERGLGVEQNTPLAIEYLQKAVEQGYEPAKEYLKEYGISPASVRKDPVMGGPDTFFQQGSSSGRVGTPLVPTR